MHDQLEIAMDRASLRQMMDNAIAAERERCAKIADAQIGAAERDRIAKGRWPNPFMPEEAMASIRDEERGETIAAQMIAAAIRKM